MTAYDPTFLPKLIDASKALNDVQKKWLHENLDKLPEDKKQRLFTTFEKEQSKQYEINQKRINLNNGYLVKKTKLVNKYNEGLGNINEKNVLKELGEEMDSVFSETA